MDHSTKKRKPHWPSFARGIKREAGRIAEEEQNFNSIIEKAEGIEDPYYRAQALAWIARSITSSGKDRSQVFLWAIEASEKVEQDWRRSEILVQVSSEMIKTRTGDFVALIDAIEDISDQKYRYRALETVRRRLDRAGVIYPKKTGKKISRGKVSGKDIRGKTMLRVEISKDNKKVTLGLFNTYMGKTLQDAHIRAIARAAPLCYAFDLNLGLFDFPVDDVSEIILRIESVSRVGESGEYIRKLFKEGRLFVMEIQKSRVLSGIGNLIATTSKPDPKKRIPLDKIAKKGYPFCILMGLGSQGLPKRILKMSKFHLELTDRGIPLETCTAMGVLAAKLKSC